MAANSEMRASDYERESVAELLGEHMAVGRLNKQEFEERIKLVYGATTLGELDALCVDLPGGIRHEPAPPFSGGHSHIGFQAEFNGGVDNTFESHSHSARRWLSTSLLCTLIWAMTSVGSHSFIFFWPMWVIGPWGTVLLGRRLLPATNCSVQKHESAHGLLFRSSRPCG